MDNQMYITTNLCLYVLCYAIKTKDVILLQVNSRTVIATRNAPTLSTNEAINYYSTAGKVALVAFHHKPEGSKFKKVKCSNFYEVIYENIEDALKAVSIFNSNNWRSDSQKAFVR